jgi:DNA-binding protein H-NS
MARSFDLGELSGDDLMGLLEMAVDRLSVPDLVRLMEMTEAKRQEKLAEAKQAVVDEMRGRLTELGLSLEDVLPGRTRRRGRRRSRSETGQSIPVKYRSPEGGTWSGRGRTPQWLQALEEQGHQRDEFAVRPEEA